MGSVGGYEIGRRELGLYPPLVFARRASGSEALVKRIVLCGELEGHKGCVNTLNFNTSGDVLVSGSEDKNVILWNWAVERQITAYSSGHSSNVSQARFMPFNNDGVVVTTAADGQVRVGYIKGCGQVDTRQLGKHRGRSHKIIVEPGSPHVFYSCGEDGIVQHFDLRRQSSTNMFYCSSSSFSDMKQRPLPLSSIAMDPRNPNYVAVGGYDEYARVYDIRRSNQGRKNNNCGNYHDQPLLLFSPHHLIGSRNTRITDVSYSSSGELLVSYYYELIYLFSNDSTTLSHPSHPVVSSYSHVYSGHKNASSRMMKSVRFFGPGEEYVVSGSECGHVFIWKKKGGKLVRMVEGDRFTVSCVEPHPCLPYLVTSGGVDKNIKLWGPVSDDLDGPLPSNANAIMEANNMSSSRGGGRFDMDNVSPGVLVHLLRLRRSSDNNGLLGNPNECNIC